MRVNIRGIDNSTIEMRKFEENGDWYKMNPCTGNWVLNHCAVCKKTADTIAAQKPGTLFSNEPQTLDRRTK
jgi:hypothetical protein